MISYDDYLNRIQKVAKAKNFVHRFRFLLIGAFLLIIAATTGLLVAKGTVTTAMYLPAKITFGDNYSPTQASAFLSSVRYEYSLEGSDEWSSNKPVKAGKYLARTVTDKAFGKNYSEPVHFEILPREAVFSIGSDSVVYGEIPEECTVTNLVSGLKLETEELRFNYASYSGNKTHVNVIKDTVKIIDAYGDDYTSCFSITYEGKELEILPRAITLQADSVTQTYSGSALEIKNEVSEKSLSQLADGDTLTVVNGAVSEDGEPIPAPKDKGRYGIEVKSFKIMKGNIDVTHLYDVKKLTADVVINARAITITTGSAEKVYDGNKLESATFTHKAEELAAGHRIAEQSAYLTLTDVGSIVNINSYSIYDSAGVDVSDNYVITTTYGKLAISKRKITILTATDEKEYDGQKFYNHNYEVITETKIVEWENHFVNNDYGIYTVAESGKNLLAISIMDRSGRDITDINYEITYEYGMLTLLKRKITVETGTSRKVYDGDPLSKPTFTLYGSLAFRHEITPTDSVSITNAGSVSNAIGFEIINGNEKVTVNYEISTVYGTLTVEKRPISVTTGTNWYTFDGLYHSYSAYETLYYGANRVGLIGNDKLTISNITEIRDFSVVENKFDLVDESGNYDIKSVTYGTLAILPRSIRVIMGDAEKEYDGTPLTNLSYRTNLNGSETEFGLVEGDELILDGTPSSITNVGTVKNGCPYKVPNSNYVIADVVMGELKVYARVIDVVLYDLNAVYGEEIKYPSGTGNIANANTCRLASGEEIEVFVALENADINALNPVGRYTIIADEQRTRITNASGVETTSNYDITYVNSTLVIEARTVTVTTEDNSKIYDGTPLQNNGYSATGVLVGQEVYEQISYSIVNVDESGLDRAVYGIRDILSKQDVTDNYIINYDYGYLGITARPITVKTASDSKVYDGKPLVHTGYETYYFEAEGIEGLLGEDELILVSAASITDVGDGNGVKNECVFEVPNSNYEIKSYDYGTLKITARKIIVYTDSAEKIYDKTPLTCNTYTTKYAHSDEEGLLNGDSLIITGELASITEVGDGTGIENIFEFEMPNSNYALYDTVYGTLKITPREIVVVTGSAEKEYDGTPLGCTDYKTYLYGDRSQVGLIEGDGLLNPTFLSSRIVVGSQDNVCTFEVPSNNYEIADYEYGTLTIKPRAITIEISEVKDVTYGETFNYPTGKGNFKNAETCRLAEGEALEIAVIYYKLTYVDDEPSVIGWYEADDTPIEQPKNAGTYKVVLDTGRTKIYKGGDELEDGLSNYFIAVVTTTATIDRKYISLTLKSEEITYGEGEDFVPEYSFDVAPEDMPYGEELRFNYFLYYFDKHIYYSPYHIGEYEIFWQDGLTVYKDGVADFIGKLNYWVSLSEGHATVTVNPKEITVELLDIDGIEYGEDYSYPVYEGNYKNSETLDLPYGDKITLFDSGTRDDMVLNVGIHYGYVNVDQTKTLVNGVADTSDYIITYISGNLEIVQRQIIVTNLGADKVYDGTPLSNGGYATRSANNPLKAGLLFDDELIPDGELVSITNVAESGALNENRYTVGGNYEIIGYEDEPLEIIPRKIVIATDSGEWEYDGQYHSLESFNDDESYYYNESTGEKESALVLDHYFVALTPAKIKDVGSIRNVDLGENEIYDGEGNPVTDNYEIDIENSGTLTITPRHIVVRTHSDTKVYDGTPLTCEGYSTYYYMGNMDSGDSYGEESEVGLIEGDELILKNDQPIYTTYVWEHRVLNMNEYESPVGEYGNVNYVIEYTIFGYLEITPREINVEIGEKTKVYDASPYVFEEGEDIYEDGLAEGEKLQVSIRYTDMTDNEFNSIPSTDRFNVGTYRIYLDLENCIIYRDGEILERGMENYRIYYYGGTLTVTSRKVIITQNDIEAVYGDEIIYNGYEGGEDIPYYMGVQDKLTFNYGYYYQDENGELVLLSDRAKAGEYVIHAHGDTALVNGEKPFNYEFTFVNGTLLVIPRMVNIVLKNKEVTYGEEIELPEGADAIYPVELVYDDTFEVFLTALSEEKFNAGTYYGYIMIDEAKTLVNGERDTSNYIFNYISADLIVKQRGISVKLNEPEAEYTYGEIYTYETGIGNYLYAENLAYGEQLEVAVLYYLNGEYYEVPKNAGTYTLIISELIAYDESGRFIWDGGNNYYVEDVQSASVELTVKRPSLHIEIDDSEYIYGFEAPEITFSILDYYTMEETVLPFGEVLTFDFLYMQGTYSNVKPEDVGEYVIYTVPSLAYINGEREGVANYIIVGAHSATLTIHRRQIVVETATSSHVYDGAYYSNVYVNSHYYNDESTEGFVGGYQPDILWNSVPSVKDVIEGEIENRFEFEVSQNYEIVGEIGYGKISVTPRELTVELNRYEIIYGEEFGYPVYEGNYLYAENIVYGEQLEIYAYLVADKNVPDIGEYEIKAYADKTLVNGGEPTNYYITYISGVLTISVRRIVITTESCTWEYDGEEHSHPYGNPEKSYYLNVNGENAGKALVEGHEFEAGEYPTIKEVGWKYNTCYGGDIFDCDRNTVTANYTIVSMADSGILTITPRRITITTGSAEKEYDGEELYNYSAEVTNGEIANGQIFFVSYFPTIINVAQTSKGNNVLEITIISVNNEIVTDNYAIEYVYGTLTVLPRRIVVITADDSKVYDGTPLRKVSGYKTYHFEHPEEEGLLNGDSLSVVSSVSITDFGSIVNACEYRPNSSNYMIMDGYYEYGTISITKRHITVETLSKTKMYDGNPMCETGYNTYLTEDLTSPGLIGKDKLILDEDSIVYVTEIGENKVNKLVFSIESENYEIDGYIYGELVIIQRRIIIITATDSKTYDGTPLENYTDYTVILEGEEGEGMLEGDTLEVTSWTTITDVVRTSSGEVGWTDNECTFELPSDIYYLVEIRYGTLTINPAPLKVVLHDVANVPYGQTLFYPEGEGNYVSAEGLIDNQTLELVVYYTDESGTKVSPVNAGVYSIYIDWENSLISGVSGLGNYELDYEYKTAEIQKIALKIVLTQSSNYSYNGTSKSYDSNAYIIIDGSTVDGETLLVVVKYFDEDGNEYNEAPSDAGNYTIVFDYENSLIRKDDGFMPANINYDIVCESELEYIITPAKFKVTFTDVESIYNGLEFDYGKSGAFTIEGLFGEDELQCNVKYYLDGEETTALNAGIYRVVFDTDNIEFINGKASNYEFDYSNSVYSCELEITRRSIRVQVNDREIEYTVEVDPSDESYSASFTVNGLVLSGEAFVVDDEENAGATYYYDGTTNLPSGVGIYEVTVKFLNEEVMKNYDVTALPGTLTITGRKVLVTPYYTGEDLVYNGYELDVQELIRQGKLGITHIHNLYGLPEDDRYGFAPEDLEMLTIVYVFWDAESGNLYENGAAPKDAGNYYVSVKVSGYDEERYTVETAIMPYFLIIRRKDVNITSISSLEKAYDKKAPEGIRIEYSGICEPDVKACSIIPLYIDANGQVATAINAGTYVIQAKINIESIAKNYNIVYGVNATGTVIVNPIVLYLRPQSREEYYQGRNITLGESDFEFVDVEHSKLVAGDKIIIEPSASLDPSKTYVTVSIRSARVIDIATNGDMTGNYKLYYSYDRSVMGSDYSSSDFKGKLEYLIRNIYYRQIVSEDQKLFVYDGTAKTIEGRLYEIVQGKGEGLYKSDRIEISSATVGPQVGEYSNWLKLKVYNSYGVDVSRVYNLILENADASTVIIKAVNITLQIFSTVTDEKIENKSVFYTSTRFENRYALDKIYYSVDGLVNGHELDIIAIKSHGVWNFAVVIYVIKASGSLTDRSDCVNLKVVKEDTLNIRCFTVECHSLTSIQSDITFTLKISYEDIVSGKGLTTYDDRPALTSAQYKIDGLLPDHALNTQVVVVPLNGYITLAILITNGRSDRSYYYYLNSCILPADFPDGEVNIVLVSSIMEVRQDATISITAKLDDIKAGKGLAETFDGKLALSGAYTVEGLLPGHTAQVIPMMSGGKVTLAVLIFEAKLTNGVMSGRSDRSYLYNLVVKSAPAGADVVLVSSLNDLKTDIKITLNAAVTAANLKNGAGVTTSAIDGRNVLDSSMFTLENYFGVSPLASGHYVEIVVEREGNNFNLYVVVYQLSSSGKRSDRSYLYSVNVENVQSGITVEYINTADLGDAGLN
ncbi:MAG: hypothetical protein J1G07_05100 [Clostridiales bacterium]|nr:hypothetical protein [Clostridiales bacterium]